MKTKLPRCVLRLEEKKTNEKILQAGNLTIKKKGRVGNCSVPGTGVDFIHRTDAPFRENYRVIRGISYMDRLF